jgi:protein-disulfide isomerase
MFNRLKGFLEVLSTVLLIVLAGALLWRLYQMPAAPRPQDPVQDVAGLSIPADKVTHVRGEGSVVLVEFADYECPFCARHAQTTAPTIKKELLDARKIRHAFLNFPLAIHPKAQKASEAAECAAKQGRFWEMHERLFEAPMALDAADMHKRAQELGLDTAAFRDCLDSGATAELVKADLEEGRRLGVNSTPAFFLGLRQADGRINLVKRINGALPFETFDEAIRDAQAPPARAAR